MIGAYATMLSMADGRATRFLLGGVVGVAFWFGMLSALSENNNQCGMRVRGI